MQVSKFKIGVGIDLGGQGASLGLVNLKNGEVFKVDYISINNERERDRGKEILKKILDKAGQILKKSKHSWREVEIISWGTAGLLGPLEESTPQKLSTVINSPNIKGLNGLNIREEVNAFCTKRNLRILFLLENDANLAGIAECFYGEGQKRGVDTLCVLTLGTGLGGSIIVKKEGISFIILRPAELGHLIIETDPKKAFQCSCGEKGCAEAMVALGGIEKWSKLFLGTKMSPKQVELLIEGGNKEAERAYSRVGYYLGVLIKQIRRFINPQAIVFSGGIAKAFKYFYPALAKVLRDDSFFKKEVYGLPKILMTEINPDNLGLFGACGLAYYYHQNYSKEAR